MKTVIEIDCEDEKDLLIHLSVIRQQIRAEIKRQGGTLHKDFDFEDSNCYGNHDGKSVIEPKYHEAD